MIKINKKGTIKFENGEWIVENPLMTKDKRPVVILIPKIGIVPLPNKWTQKELEDYVYKTISELNLEKQCPICKEFIKELQNSINDNDISTFLAKYIKDPCLVKVLSDYIEILRGNIN